MNSKDNILTLPHADAHLFPPLPDCCEISVACYRGDYSASRIAHAVEDAEAHLLNLNVTSELQPTGEITVDLRVNHRNGGSVARSLERYGYRVLSVRSDSDAYTDLARARINELMAHLEV